MIAINSYYSNVIEGNSTPLAAIRSAGRGFAVDKKFLQESLGHVFAQEQMLATKPDIKTIFSPDFILGLHYNLYQSVSIDLRFTGSYKDGKASIIPGNWRDHLVEVGRHTPPQPEYIASLMEKFCDTYHNIINKEFSDERKIIAIMAAHHRFEWIHPFIDGNGRVGRLFTDAALRAIGLESNGIWSLSRGLGLSAWKYKNLMEDADEPRHGDRDGRGQLTEKGLLRFCDYMLDMAINQLSRSIELLSTEKMHHRIAAYVEARSNGQLVGFDATLHSAAIPVLCAAYDNGDIERDYAIELCKANGGDPLAIFYQLKTEGLLSESDGQPTLRWEFPLHAEQWYLPS